MKLLRIAVGITLVLSVAGLAVGVMLLTRPAAAPQSALASARAQIKTLNGQARSLNSRLTADDLKLSSDDATLATLQASTTAGEVSGIRRTLGALKTCLPQIQTEIGGLGINWSVQVDASQDSFSITNPTIISTDCNQLLYGTGA